MFGVADSPQTLSRLFSSENYILFGRDLIFVAIAILAIGLIDTWETFLLLRNRRTTLSKALYLITFGMMICIYLQLICYAVWSGKMTPHTQLTADAATTLLYLVLIAALSALFARVTLLSSPTG
jgi:hypothetical protein